MDYKKDSIALEKWSSKNEFPLKEIILHKRAEKPRRPSTLSANTKTVENLNRSSNKVLIKKNSENLERNRRIRKLTHMEIYKTEPEMGSSNKSVPIIKSLKPQKIIKTVSKIKRSQSGQCVWLFPRAIPSGPFFQPMKGRLIKDSAQFGIMFRPEASNSNIEKLACKKRRILNVSYLKRLYSKPRF